MITTPLSCISRWAGHSGSVAPLAKPSPELIARFTQSLGSPMGYEAPAEQTYRSIKPLGQNIQAEFNRQLGKALVSPPRIRKGHVLVATSARNEEKDIYRSVGSLVRAVQSDRNTELAVVSNASTDRTVDEVRRLAADMGSRVELVDHIAGQTSPKTAAKPGTVRLHLMEEMAPGKTRGLLKVRDLFAEQGSYPEWIAQVDADVTLSPAAISKLVKLATDADSIGASGNPEKVRRDGQPLITPGKQPPRGILEFEHNTLIGSLSVSRSLPWVVGYQTILDKFPACATEDTLLSVMYSTLGFKPLGRMEADHIEAQMLAPETVPDARKQMARWALGKRHLDLAWGEPALKQLGARPMITRELRAVARTAIHRPSAFLELTQDGQAFSSSVMSQRANLARAALGAAWDSTLQARKSVPQSQYSWEPGR